MKSVVIIGNGIAGITAGRHIRKLNDAVNITVISSETPYFYSRTALMYVYMGHLKFEHTKPYEDWFWQKNRIDLAFDKIENIDFNTKTLEGKNKTYQYEVLILATGSKTKFFNWPGQHLKGVQGLYSYQDLMLMHQNTQNTKTSVVAGGGLLGVEMAEMLKSRGIDVFMLIREKTFWGNVFPVEEGNFIAKHLTEDHDINLQFSNEIDEIIGDSKNQVTQVKTNFKETINCQFVGITTGVEPNIDFLKNTNLNLNKGILVDDFLKTNLPDVYAIGDCAEVANPKYGRKSIEAMWYTGRMMGETVAQTICGNPTAYNPGIWFNSAKFFDIEYQTYGLVPANLSKDFDFYLFEDWPNRRMLKLVYHIKDQTVCGINALGIRINHQIADDWLRSLKNLDFYLHNFKILCFDAEFSKPVKLKAT